MLDKVIRNRRDYQFSVTHFETFKEALFMPFKDLPKAKEDPNYKFYRSVTNWRLSTGV